MPHTFSDPDLAELDRIWPLGRQLDIPPSGTIVVAGAYEGRYIAYLSELFPGAYLYGYEPQTAAYSTAQIRVGGKRGVTLFNLALGTADRAVSMGQCPGDGATVCSGAVHQQFVHMVDAVQTLQGFQREISLLLLNCEGSEWALLPYLLDEMMHHRIRSMAIQFHPKYVSKNRACLVLQYLDEYYDRGHWDYPHWCYFVRKN